MINYYLSLNVVIQTLIACTFTFLVTSLGASLVYFFKKVNNTVLDAMLSLSGGIMISASFFSLLLPAINNSNKLNISILIISLSFIFGGLFLILFDKIINLKNNSNKSLKRSILLFSSITLHNIPEGIAIGVAFASSGGSIMGAFMLALGIGIQNFPEGTAISLPLKREGYSSNKAFFLGLLSGIVEPIFGVIGCILATYVENILPILLAFASGAMIYVSINELLVESSKNKYKNIMGLFMLFGFSIMMFLDVTLG